ncbi:MAG: hypothetical protein ACR2NP_04495 [Pirellulaceae bacterium]
MSTNTIRNQHTLEMTTDPRVSAYDKTATFLVAAVVVLGFLVFVLFMIWLTLFAGAPSQKPAIAITELAGNDDRPEGVADDWQEPGVEDFPEVEQPQLADALEAVTDSVSSVRAQLEKVDGNAAQMGRGAGLGDKRQRGRGGGNSDIIPEWDRWKIEYSAGTLAEYMNILQSFGITLGCVSQVSNQIQYLSSLTNAQATITVGDRSQAGLYFHNTRNRLRRWDQNKAAASGVDVRNKLIVHFYPTDIRQQLLELEHAEYSREGKELIEVKQTVFRVRPAGGGFEYYVESVEYRDWPK